MRETVKGRCPACGSHGTLFVADGGYLTCSLDRCPEPGKVSDLLMRPDYHVVEIGAGGWAMQHETVCFPNLLGCEIHERFAAEMAKLPEPPAAPGRYKLDSATLRLTPSDLRRTVGSGENGDFS